VKRGFAASLKEGWWCKRCLYFIFYPRSGRLSLLEQNLYLSFHTKWQSFCLSMKRS